MTCRSSVHVQSPAKCTSSWGSRLFFQREVANRKALDFCHRTLRGTVPISFLSNVAWCKTDLFHIYSHLEVPACGLSSLLHWQSALRPTFNNWFSVWNSPHLCKTGAYTLTANNVSLQFVFLSIGRKSLDWKLIYSLSTSRLLFLKVFFNRIKSFSSFYKFWCSLCIIHIFHEYSEDPLIF